MRTKIYHVIIALSMLMGGLVVVPAAWAAPSAQVYDREAAAAWALANVNGVHRYREDCTWFVSQALWAGGMPKTRDWTSEPAFASDNPPLTATVADYFKNYLAYESAFATITELSWTQNNIPEAELGDVIAYDWNDPNGHAGPVDGKVDHLAIITGFSGQYPLVSAHTLDVANQGWTYSQNGDRWISQIYPGSRVYLIHIKD